MTDTLRIFEYDRAFSLKKVAGMDEAGRGPLAGPVVAACVIMPLDKHIDGIYDSKKVGEKKRECLYEKIVATAIAYGIGIVDNVQIDKINILNATKQAMRSAYTQMGIAPDILLVDAVTGLNIACESKAIIKGDATSYNIAAASIVAKVTRDRMMREYDKQYPQYGFAKNKGYGTKIHTDALRSIGYCPLHRKSFIGNFCDIALQTSEKGKESEKAE